MRPLILIPCPTSFDLGYNRQCLPEYVRAVESEGGEAREVPLDIPLGDLDRMLAEADGILLPGSGADVAPDRYGHARQTETAPADPAREAIDRRLLEHSYRTDTPTLAICFGLQSLNVFNGGTLVQHLAPMPVNHRAGRPVAQAHATVVSSSSRLGQLIEKAEDVQPDQVDGFLRLWVNSSHHQAVGALGTGLQVVGRSTEDGIVEAAEDADRRFIIGVQWHPERTLEQSHASRRIVGGFVEASRQHA